MENAEVMVQNVLGDAQKNIRNFAETRRVVSRVYVESLRSFEHSQKVYGYNFNFLEDPQMIETIKTYKNSHKPIELSMQQTFANIKVHLANNSCYLECIKRLKQYLEETKNIKYELDDFYERLDKAQAFLLEDCRKLHEKHKSLENTQKQFENICKSMEAVVSEA